VNIVKNATEEIKTQCFVAILLVKVNSWVIKMEKERLSDLNKNAYTHICTLLSTVTSAISMTLLHTSTMTMTDDSTIVTSIFDEKILLTITNISSHH
jgi:hypothetical protein